MIYILNQCLQYFLHSQTRSCRTAWQSTCVWKLGQSKTIPSKCYSSCRVSNCHYTVSWIYETRSHVHQQYCSQSNHQPTACLAQDIRKCLLKCSRRINVLLQTAHSKGLSPVWVRTCLWRPSFSENCLLHTSQWNGFSPVWVIECFCR
jgi:hypothetical protein